MVNFGSILQQIETLSANLDKVGWSAENVNKTIQDLSKMQISTQDPKDVEIIEKKIRALKEYQKASKDTYESERKSLELVVGQNKQLLELLDKTILKHAGVAKAVYTTASAYVTLRDKGDLGMAISQVSALAGKFGIVGVVLGQVISTAIRFQDRIQAVNKTIIDATASTGRFTEGLAAAQQRTLDISVGIAGYAQKTGVATDELYKHIGGLAALGFSLEEAGIDRATGRVTSLTDAIRGQTSEWGALSTAIGVSRATGLDIQSVMQTMGIQVKTLGDSVEDVAETFGQLSAAAERSGLSTQILLPLVRGLQDQFKFLGIDSASATEMLGRAGQVAEAAGTGAGAAVDVMARAMGGIARMDLGQMAFFGQQLGMGGGLAAGFQFRAQAGGPGGGNLALEIGRTIGNIMGGPGNIISEDLARNNESLAAIRLAQEQFTMQTLGLGQNEARVFLNISEQLEQLEARGEGNTEEAKTLRKTISGFQMGEAEYRAKTLTAQQKIANILELISRLVGRAVLIFVRAFAGGAAGDRPQGILQRAMAGAAEGKGLDEIFGAEGGIDKAMDEAFRKVDPVIEGFGRRLGQLFGLATTNVYTTIASIIGGALVFNTISRAVTGLFSRVFGLQALGGLVRTVAGRGAAGATGEIAGGVVGEMVGGAVRRTPLLQRNVGDVLRGGVNQMRSALRMSTGSLLKMNTGLLGFGVVLAAGAIAIKKVADAADLADKATKARIESSNKAEGVANKMIQSQLRLQNELEKLTGLTGSEARQITRKIHLGEELTEKEKKAWEEKKKFVAQQALAETQRMRTIALQAGSPGVSAGYKIGLHEEQRRLESMAKGEPITPVQDALNIFKKGWLYASPGDVVVRADSVGKAGTEGPPGSARDIIAGDILGMRQRAAESLGATRRIEDTEESIERDVILNVRFMHDLIGQIAEEKVLISVEKDLIAPGKAGKAMLRHGKGGGYG